MRQKNETATSFNELKAITQAIMLKNDALTNATHQESDRTQEARAKKSNNADASEIAHKSALTPKARERAKKHALKPTKKAFSERQITTIRDNSQASAKKSLETQPSAKQGDNANAFKSEQANNSNLREKPSDEALKQGLTTHQNNQKGGNNAKA